MNDQDNEDSDCELNGDERAWADLEGGTPAYGKGYGSGFRSQLQRAIWGDNEDDLLYDAPSAKRRRETKREKLRYITKDQFYELFDAVCFANLSGRVMNVEFTLQLGNLGILGESAAFGALGIWMKRYRDWCSQRDIERVYIYVWERPPGRSLHLHMQFHIPAEYLTDFKGWARGSVQSLCKPAAYASHTQPQIELRRTARVKSQWKWFEYLIKGLSPEICLPGTGPRKTLVDQLGIRAEPQGEIAGKRVGSSRSISWQARNDAQIAGTFAPWRPDRDAPAEAFWTDVYLKMWQSRTEDPLF
ncbi:hypothetical protein EN851_20190 [Mesorhizobium sp. M8A.F.Ca.ET.208.01.1.1]|uniref:hypothetical protein n=1 Tax=unclassified Mesorhizobium TaxID=325217 RepID=UPI0010937F72|nr:MULTISPECIES: hypothetical protein [unclassified Mesorhizobium]TGQ89959.1 hypothetical protein EN851_20190 [Mesorhizobium sp. M8A.F.Ca.ET.208.01.1.1]TGT50798.1 hypothetical protein EN810_20090 [Mesorhizobium sp. M8A.F.Ca.ET.167.01.1.1]